MKDPAFLFYPGDYLRDTQCLSEKAQVSYDRIMCEHMRNICISKQQLKFFTKRLSDDEREELLMTLDKVSGGYQIKWVADSIEKRRAYSESRRKNRSSKPKKDIKTYDEHMENEIEDVIDNEYSDEFLAFWKSYPKKVGKADAYKRWAKEKPRLEDVLNALKWQRTSEQWLKEGGQFIPNPSTYINQHRWEDEPPRVLHNAGH